MARVRLVRMHVLATARLQNIQKQPYVLASLESYTNMHCGRLISPVARCSIEARHAQQNSIPFSSACREHCR